MSAGCVVCCRQSMVLALLYEQCLSAICLTLSHRAHCDRAFVWSLPAHPCQTSWPLSICLKTTNAVTFFSAQSKPFRKNLSYCGPVENHLESKKVFALLTEWHDAIIQVSGYGQNIIENCRHLVLTRIKLFCAHLMCNITLYTSL